MGFAETDVMSGDEYIIGKRRAKLFKVSDVLCMNPLKIIMGKSLPFGKQPL